MNYLFLLFVPLLTFLSVKAAELLVKKLYIYTILMHIFIFNFVFKLCIYRKLPRWLGR